MSAHQEITQELRSISKAVADLNNTNVFGVPLGYFETSPEMIMKQIRENKMTEDAQLSPLLASLKKQNPFRVPDGYFGNTQFILPQKVTRVVPLLDRKSILRYAVAASLAGMLFSATFYFSRAKNEDPTLVAGPASMSKSNVSDDAMQSYINDLESFTIDPFHQEDTYSENLLVQMDRETVSQMLAEVSETGISEFINDKNSAIKNNN